MLFNSKFSEEEIEREKGVIIEEINMSEDTPEDVVSELHSRVIWGEDSLSLPILGDEKTVKSFTRQELIDYVQSYYIPENSVISICGNVDINNVEKLVDNYFGNWVSNNKIITHYPSSEIQWGSAYKNKEIEQLHISLGMKGLPTGNNDIYPLLLLNNILGGGVSSLLFQKVREEYGLCYTIYSYMTPFNNTGVINIYTSLNANYAIDALHLIIEELEAFIKTSIHGEKLIKAKEQIKGNYILGLESTSSRMFSNGKAALFLNKLNRPEEIIKKIDDITTEKLDEVMQITFANKILNAAFVGSKINIDKYNEILNIHKVAFKQDTKSKLV